MGFYGGAYYTYTYQYIWNSSAHFSFDYVNCNGNESKLSDCFHAENTTCGYDEGVLIYCNTNIFLGESIIVIACFKP